MKTEERLSVLTGSILALVIALGSIGCLQSAFHLPVAQPGLLWICVAAVSLFYAKALRRKYGALGFTCLAALAAGFLFREGTAVRQFSELLCRLTATYDRAYHWGVLKLGESSQFTDLPLGIGSTVIAVAVIRSVCLHKKTWPAVLAALLPPAACVVVTDTVPKEGYLFLLMAGLALLILPASVRRENTLQGIRLTAMIASPVVLVLAGLFWTVPQAGYVDQSAVVRDNILTAITHLPQLADQRTEHTVSRQVDLTLLGPRIPLTYPVLEITAEKNGTLYLRGQDFDCYDGVLWQSTESRQETFSVPGKRGQTVTIETRKDRDVRFLPYYPQEDAILTGGFAKNSGGMRRYTIFCSDLPENWWQTAYLSHGKDDPGQEAYLSLPENTREKAIRFLAGHLDAGASNTRKAETIAALVKDSAPYSLSPDSMPPEAEDFALWFLEQGTSGYCIHFATAATVLLRAADVPARYVTGYLAKTVAGEKVTVTEADAHAWAEYYEPQLHCWIPLEVTPAAIIPPESTAAAMEETLPAETLPKETIPLAQQPTEATPVFTELTAADVPAVKKSRPSPWLLILALFPVLEIQRSVRMELRRRQQRRGSTNQKALLRWREAEKLTRLLKETPGEELFHLAQKAKFSQYPLTVEEIQRFDSFNRSCLRRLKEKPWYLRLAYRYGYAVY